MTALPSAATPAGAILILSLVIALGLCIGSLRIRGVGLGVAGVLFSGLLAGHFHVTPEIEVLEFVREFGLILFVYSIGLQIGPGFASSLRREGLPLNAMAAAVVFLGAGLCLVVHRIGGVDLPAAVGLLSGATTNTPSLGSAQEALRSAGLTDPTVLKRPALAYAVAYPFGIIGIILSMILIRRLFRIDAAREVEAFSASRKRPEEELRARNFLVQNPSLDGQTIGRSPSIRATGVTVSRVLHDKSVAVADADTVLHDGDVVVAVGNEAMLKHFGEVVGPETDVDVRKMGGAVTTRLLMVTHKDVAGRTIEELDLADRFGIVVTRIRRADSEFSVRPTVRLQFGDAILVVGHADDIAQAGAAVGDSKRVLNQPQIASLFIGIALGALLGVQSVKIPGLPGGLRLGLAGGPLIVAILFSRFGRVGPFVPYIPNTANHMLRDFGIALFLACVGLKAGDQFVAVLASGDGLRWMAWAMLITLAPLLIVGTAARLIWKTNFASICGLLAGAMTDPPALAFASQSTSSDAPSVSYATVYPLTMILRILLAQIIVVTLF